MKLLEIRIIIVITSSKRGKSYWWLLYPIIGGILAIIILWPRDIIDRQISSSITDEIRQKILAGESVTIIIEINPLSGEKLLGGCINVSGEGVLQIYSIVVHHIKNAESLRLEPYIEPNGRTNQGYGHWIRPGEQAVINLSEEEATMIMLADYGRALDSVNTIFKDLERHQRMAIACLVFRMGWTAFTATPLFEDITRFEFTDAYKRWKNYCRWENLIRKMEILKRYKTSRRV